jgi:hypothetical protein
MNVCLVYIPVSAKTDYIWHSSTPLRNCSAPKRYGEGFVGWKGLVTLDLIKHFSMNVVQLFFVNNFP